MPNKTSDFVMVAARGIRERCFDRNKYPWFSKADIANHLGQVNGYTSYLEVATSTTGHRFAQVSSSIFSTRKRALYNVSEDYADGLSLDYTSTERDGEQCFKALVAAGQTFDVVFVDPYHSYEASRLDLEYGLRLLNEGGVLVVHDCNPPKRSLTSSAYQDGDWLGETYLAFLDFVRDRADLEYCVVNSDWGVGLIWPAGAAKPACSALPERPVVEGLDLRDWGTFSRHRRPLLRLISVRQFRGSFTGS